ncbi:MAG: twin-arginine translocase subunit TatC [Candidatus Omnitrophica bacterium]|nr:twin-arginine translocase subunit TatC [Candidatus Omnitrophota bacterium]
MKESLRAESGGIRGPVLMPEEEKSPLLDHLEQLRWCLLRSLGWTAAGTAVGLRFSGQILHWLIHPVGRVVFLSPAEPFLVHLKVAFLAGIGLALPFLAWEIWRFLSPALFPGERHPILLLAPASAGLFALGALFSWKVLLPTALRFLLSFGSEELTPMVTVGSYVSFAGWLILAGGLIFQMPFVAMLLARGGWLHPWTLLRHWRIAVVSILVVAAVLTPTPDIVTQLLLAAPMGALYLVSIGLAVLTAR